MWFYVGLARGNKEEEAIKKKKKAMSTFNEEDKKKFKEIVYVLVFFSEKARSVSGQESVSEPGVVVLAQLLVLHPSNNQMVF